jgi:hypothetical protein
MEYGPSLHDEFTSVFISTNGLEYREQTPTTWVHNFFLWGYLKELVYIQKPFANICDEIRGDPDFLNKLTAAS